jgi:GNAT superfamily N-acetyltransferase
MFAWILDVFIFDDHQHKGFGKKLIRAIMSHKKLQNLQRWGLGTDDEHGLYKQFGFKPLSTAGNMMEVLKVGD